MKKKVICFIVALSFIFCGLTFAGEQENPTGTIVGADQLV